MWMRNESNERKRRRREKREGERREGEEIEMEKRKQGSARANAYPPCSDFLITLHICFLK